ncbi:class I SAM-dependent methyltransferase [Stappia sp. ES.058]|uniref:class I SAM-dependent methyltransferase n=1 Tax=Stappia sp. ES.058 TaxID=1881061 RepID=UPI00087C4204|nr:class I SAM-dependent methyltransferase [Stappia sp. ES.058]SDT89157.1 Methyltransferase domain-containing protein [Stappia sp. ES.058]
MLSFSPVSPDNMYRKKRVERFRAMIEDYVDRRGHCRIIDLGGTHGFWEVWRDLIDYDNVSITCVNIDVSSQTPVDFDLPIELVEGSACDLPQYADNAFDLVFSNSVIEHVGLWSNKVAFAHEARRLAPSYFIQTPNYGFPIEPHARFPMLHWLPRPIAYRIHMRMHTGFYPKAATLDDAMFSAEDAIMLDRKQMRHLFPDANVELERFFGLAKSLLAIRHMTADPQGAAEAA